MTERSPATADVTPATLDYEQAAAYAGVGRSAIYEAWSSGELASLKVGKRRLFLPADLDAWLASKREPATA